jgi:hypothetical protein
LSRRAAREGPARPSPATVTCSAPAAMSRRMKRR